MLVKLGNEQYLVEFDKQNNNIIVDGTPCKVFDNYKYAYKLYKRPQQIGAWDGLKGLEKFFNDHLNFAVVWLLEICRFIKGVKNG